jgi:dihydrofolate reductase
MTRVRVHNFTISLDGYGAGPDQTRETPLGVGGESLHAWFLPTRTFQQIIGKPGGTTGVEDEIAGRMGQGVGAYIMGRNMFGPVRGPWPDDTWRGWWGNNPPYHCPVFVLTHHARAPIEMDGGTVFHFVTSGIRDAYDRAVAAADGKDIQIGGGVSTVRQYLEAGLIDELHVAIAPILLGSGEHLFRDLDLTALGYECTTHQPTATATHVTLTRRRPEQTP